MFYALCHALAGFFARRVTRVKPQTFAQLGDAIHYITNAQVVLANAVRDAIGAQAKVVLPYYGPINSDGLNVSVSYDATNVGRMNVHVESYFPLINEMVRQALLDQHNFRGALVDENPFGFTMMVDGVHASLKSVYIECLLADA